MLAGVASGDGIFVAVGDRGTILTSPDGIAWSPQPSGTSNYLAHVAYANGLFVAVGGFNHSDNAEGVGTILTSPDGLRWTARTSGTGNILSGIAFGSGTFVAVGYNNTLLPGTLAVECPRFFEYCPHDRRRSTRQANPSDRRVIREQPFDPS